MLLSLRGSYLGKYIFAHNGINTSASAYCRVSLRCYTEVSSGYGTNSCKRALTGGGITWYLVSKGGQSVVFRIAYVGFLRLLYSTHSYYSILRSIQLTSDNT